MKQKESRMQFCFTAEYAQQACITSFSQLELSVSMAIGLLGALLPVPGGMTWSPGWFGHGKLRAWLACLFARVVERYCFTCCRWACWIWYLVGFSRWVCTCVTRVRKVLYCFTTSLCVASIWAIHLWHRPAKHLTQSYKRVRLQGTQQGFTNSHSVARNEFLRECSNNWLINRKATSSTSLPHGEICHLKSMFQFSSSHRHSATGTSLFRPSATQCLIFTKLWRNKCHSRTHFTCQYLLIKAK